VEHILDLLKTSTRYILTTVPGILPEDVRPAQLEIFWHIHRPLSVGKELRQAEGDGQATIPRLQRGVNRSRRQKFSCRTHSRRQNAKQSKTTHPW
jgi:hypothetical protein